MWINKKQYEETVQTNRQLSFRVDELEMLLKVAREECDKLTERFKKQTEAALVKMDMRAMNVFSIERRDECTVVGYRFDNDDHTSPSREWWVVTTIENHDSLVKEFEAVVGAR